MRKLLAAGLVTAGALGMAQPASATTTVYTITGSFGSNEQACTQITFLFSSKDCTFGRNRPAAGGGWLGYLFGGGHYALDGTKDQVTYTPTFGDEQPPASGTFVPAADDGKIEAPITGTFTIDDNDTPGNAADDLISAEFTIGEMARNIATGQATRAVQRWTTLDHVMAPTAVSSATGNAGGGVDYVIGSRGFPDPLCSATDPTDCFPTSNSSNDFAESRFWADIPANSIGIERSGLLGDPNFVAVQPAVETGNLGATTTASFTGYSCSTNNTAADDCAVSVLVWGSSTEATGFDNVVMKISTDSTGAITSALAYWTHEYAIGFGGGPPGYNNSAQAGTFSFTGGAGSPEPACADSSAEVLQDSANNSLDAAGQCSNFAGDLTITIQEGPANGTATVSGGEIIYTPNAGYTGPDGIEYSATDGTDSDAGTFSINVAADTSPAAPDGDLSISTQGAAPGPATADTVNVANLPGYDAGNGPTTLAVTTAPGSGTASVSGTTITYTPDVDFFTGTDTIGYTLTDADGDTAAGVITVTLPDVNPGINDGSITTDQDRDSPALALGITPGNGSVAQHTLAVSSDGSSGTCTLAGTSITYTPDAGFFGTDSCEVELTDADGDSDTATISVTVNEVSNELKLPGGGGSADIWSLSLLGALPLIRRRRRT